jgi:hypothetical protein
MATTTEDTTDTERYRRVGDIVVDMQTGRSYFKLGHVLYCSDCRKKKFSTYAGGSISLFGESFWYDICKACVEEGYKRRALADADNEEENDDVDE